MPPLTTVDADADENEDADAIIGNQIKLYTGDDSDAATEELLQLTKRVNGSERVNRQTHVARAAE